DKIGGALMRGRHRTRRPQYWSEIWAWAAFLVFTCKPSLEAEPLTFNKHIAPIIFQHCVSCHRPAGASPFPLLNYDDVRKRAKEVVEVTSRKIMPPWLPKPGFGEFVNERRLSAGQIELIRRWVRDRTMEGNSVDLPPTPRWPEGWKLGPP